MPTAENKLGSHDRTWTVLIVLASAVGLVPGVFWGVPGGTALCGADRILTGEIPYRDFWTMYAPGQFYLTAGLLWLFGRELIVQGLAAILLVAAAGGMMFRLVRRLGVGRGPAGVVSALLVASLWSTSPEIDSYLPAFPLLLIAVDRVVAHLHAENRRGLLMAGGALGLSAVFKHDVAGYVALAIVVALAAAGRIGPRADRATCAGASRTGVSSFGAIGRITGAAVAVFAPPALWIAWQAGSDAWENLFVFPATDFRGVRAEAYAPLIPDWSIFREWLADAGDVYKMRDAGVHLSNWILCHVPQLVFVIAVGVVLARRRALDRRSLAAIVLFLALLVPFRMAAQVQKNTHLYSMAVASLSLGAMAWNALPALIRWRRPVRAVLLGGLSVYAIGLLIPPGIQLAEAVRGWPGSRWLDLPGTRGVRVSAADYGVYRPIVDFILQNVAEDERIYVGLARHEATVIGNMRFYYLTQRRNACRHDELHPGITDRVDVQQTIIAAIEEHRVRCIVLWDFGWSQSVLDAVQARNAAAVEGAGSDRLDRFLNANFAPIARYGEYDLLWRKGIAMPQVVP